MDKKEYLPGDNRARIKDLMKQNKVTQTRLAEHVGCSVSTISRYINGSLDLDAEKMTLIAQFFHVSTDFLLGETNTPNRKNYDIEELGLSVEAARNLYTEKSIRKLSMCCLKTRDLQRLPIPLHSILMIQLQVARLA